MMFPHLRGVLNVNLSNIFIHFGLGVAFHSWHPRVIWLAIRSERQARRAGPKWTVCGLLPRGDQYACSSGNEKRGRWVSKNAAFGRSLRNSMWFNHLDDIRYRPIVQEPVALASCTKSSSHSHSLQDHTIVCELYRVFDSAGQVNKLTMQFYIQSSYHS